MNVMVVDDDKHILQLVSIHLTREGYHVWQAHNADEALELLEKVNPDLAVVDIMMPGMNGIELTKILRDSYQIPVLILTAKGSLEDKTRGFLAGSEDYVVKPFEPKELLFRVSVILRRFNRESLSVIRVGNLEINRKLFEVSTGEQSAMIPLKEFELLSLLASHPGQAIPRRTIMEKVWGIGYEGDHHTLNTHIKRLRERLTHLEADVEIQTIRNVGYKMEAPKQ
ncbi:MAG: response regulator transcription factor [Bacillus sp. (in: firmicutes)]